MICDLVAKIVYRISKTGSELDPSAMLRMQGLFWLMTFQDFSAMLNLMNLGENLGRTLGIAAKYGSGLAAGMACGRALARNTAYVLVQCNHTIGVGAKSASRT